MNLRELLERTEFRSRLEKRVAGIFTDQNLYWKYEPRLLVGKIDKWLPDFWLPRFRCYVEVKPPEFWYETFKVKRVAFDNYERGASWGVWLIEMKPEYNDFYIIREALCPPKVVKSSPQMSLFA